MMVKAVQQFQLRQELSSIQQAENTLQAMKDSGYDGIELCGFMIRKMSLAIRMLCKMAGMPIGASGNLDWHDLIEKSGLKVVSLHEHLDGLLNDPEPFVTEAKAFQTKYIVITGMRKFDYSDENQVLQLAEKLNITGEKLLNSGIELLYHNHNCEFRKLKNRRTAYDVLIEETDPRFVNFEFDSYWAIETGCDAAALMHRLGSRMKLYHINDRGSRVSGETGSILKSDSMELGYGNIDLVQLVEIAKNYGVEAVILETHQNWIDKSAVRSFQVSSEFLNQHIN